MGASSMVIKCSLAGHGKSRDQCVDGMEKQHELLKKPVVLGVSALPLCSNFMVCSSGPICSRIHLNNLHHRAEVSVNQMEFVRCIAKSILSQKQIACDGASPCSLCWRVLACFDGCWRKPSLHFQSMSSYPYE